MEEVKTAEDLKTIEEYEANRQERGQQEEAAVKAALNALKLVVESNRAYLRYAQAQGWFKMTPEEEAATALHNALTTVNSRAIDFETSHAEKLAFEILQDVNAHTEARKVAEVLGLRLKPYEIE
jgi:hypothetical protein